MSVERIPITDRASWLAMRQADLTASDVGAFFGCDKRRTPFELAVRKMHGESDEDNAVLQRGRWQEAAVLEMLAEERPTWRIERPKVYLHDPDVGLGGTPDAVATIPEKGEVIIECKSVIRSVFDDEWSDGPPLRTLLQTLTNAMLWGASAGVVAVLVRGYATDEPMIYEVERLPEAEAKIVEGAREFRRMMDSRVLPPADFSRDGAAIVKLFDKGGGGEIDLTGHNRIGFLCEEYMAWCHRATTADRAKETLQAEIRSVLGDAEIGVHPDFNITCRIQKTGGFTVPVGRSRYLRISRKGKRAKENGEQE